MLSVVDELNVLKKLVKSIPSGKFIKFNNYYKYIIIPEQNVDIMLIDDTVIGGIPAIIIEFETDDKVELLTINVHSGKYHKKGSVVGDDIGECENCENSDVYFVTNNKVDKLIVKQQLCTENIYSYYGNQDGFNPCTIEIEYNPKQYKDVTLKGNMNVSTKSGLCHYNGKIYKLCIRKR